MAGLTEILSAALIGRAPYSRPPTVRQAVQQAYRANGRSWKATAARLGVAESTLRRWRHGGNVSEAKREALMAYTRERRAAGRLVRKGNTDDQAFRIKWTFDGRSRETAGANLRLRDGTLRQVQDQLLAGQGAQAAQTFIDGIRDPWYQDHFRAYQRVAENPDIAEAAESRFTPGKEDGESVQDLNDEALEAILETVDYEFSVQGAS